MRVIPVLLASLFLFTTTPAFAECSDTVYSKLASGYILKDVGALASDKPVVQGGYTRSCGKFTGDVWGSVGPAGKTADEIDLSGFYDDRAGPVKYQLSAQYYFVNLGHSLLKPKDDIVELYADASIPLTHGKVTVAPLVRAVQMIGVRDLPSLTLIQPGVRLSVQVSEQSALSAEVRNSFNLSQHYSNLRWSVGVSHKLTEHLTGEFGYEDTDRTRSVVSVGLRYRY